METKNNDFTREMNELFGIDRLSEWHAKRSMNIASKAGEPAFDIVRKGRKSGYMGDGLMVFIDRTPGLGLAIETFQPKNFYYANPGYQKAYKQSAKYIVIFTDGGKYRVTDFGVFVYQGEFSRKGTNGQFFDFAGMGERWGSKYGKKAYMEAGEVVYEGQRYWEREIDFKADYKDFETPHDFVTAIRKARVKTLKKYHEWGVPFRHEHIGNIYDVKTAEEASVKAKELYGVEIPAEVFQRNIDAWTDDYKSSTNYGRYAIFTPCGHNDLRFDIDYNISGREEYIA